MSTAFFIIAGIVLFAAIAVGQWYVTERRRRAIAEWGRAHGLAFDPEKVYGLDIQYPDLDCLRVGSNRYAFNTLSGDWKGRRCSAFDYHYETHSTGPKGQRQTHHHHFSAVILNSPVPLKPLSIRPEGFFDKVTGFFGFEDINFESAEFSRKFYVMSPDRKWAYDVLHARAMEFLLARPVFTLRFASSCVIAYRDRRFEPAEFTQAAEVATGLLDGLPDYLVKQQMEGVPADGKGVSS